MVGAEFTKSLYPLHTFHQNLKICYQQAIFKFTLASISKHGKVQSLSYEYHVFIHIENRTNYHKRKFLLTFKKH